MKMLSPFFASLLFLSPIFAQTADPEVVASGGGFSPAGNFSLSYTVGEAVTATGTLPSSFVLTQGFQQPDRSMIIGTKNALPDGWELKVYPNPAHDRLNIELTSQSVHSASVSVWDIAGRLVILPQDIVANTNVPIAVGTLASGVYLIRLKDEKGQVYTLEFVKSVR